jgi:hypothetical protein
LLTPTSLQSSGLKAIPRTGKWPNRGKIYGNWKERGMKIVPRSSPRNSTDNLQSSSNWVRQTQLSYYV